jgi:hypothetical protein
VTCRSGLEGKLDKADGLCSTFCSHVFVLLFNSLVFISVMISCAIQKGLIWWRISNHFTLFWRDRGDWVPKLSVCEALAETDNTRR